MAVAALPLIMIEPLVRAALLEDLGQAGDLTSDAIAPVGLATSAALVARQGGVLAGLDFAALAFRLLDPEVTFSREHDDGDRVGASETIAVVHGTARALLGAERTALNFLCRLSGIASATAAIVDAVREHPTRITCTRKTTPGLRAAEKYAVRVGGGANHRFGLDNAVLIKDNHIVVAGGVRAAVERVRGSVGHMVKIQVEVDTLAQLEEALAMDVDAVLLDNMTAEQLRKAAMHVSGRAITEASGRITAQTAPALAATGVNVISVGWLTHSAPALDIGLDFRVDRRS